MIDWLIAREAAGLLWLIGPGWPISFTGCMSALIAAMWLIGRGLRDGRPPEEPVEWRGLVTR